MLQWLLGLVCVAVVALALLAVFGPTPPSNPTQTSEWEGFEEGIVGAALSIMWIGAFAAASSLLLNRAKP